MSRLLFWWYNGFIWTGFKKTLNENDLWDLNDEFKTKNACDQFDKEYAEEYAKIRGNKGSNLKMKDVSFDDDNQNKTINILNPFFRTYKTNLIYAASFKFLATIVAFAQPFLLDLILQFIKSKDEIFWKGYFYATCVLLASVLESLLNNQYEYFINATSLKFKSALTSTIYS